MRALGTRGQGIFPKRFKPLLGDERGDRIWPSFVGWLDRASAADLVAAYAASRNPLVRQVLCDKVGFRGLRAATPLLVRALRDPSPGIRGSAADALGKIGDPATGPDFLARYQVEDESGVRQTLALGLGSTGHRPALPLLIDALDDSDKAMRYCAVWALKTLGATEALPALQRALAEEPDAWVAQTIRLALDELGGAQYRPNPNRPGDES